MVLATYPTTAGRPARKSHAADYAGAEEGGQWRIYHLPPGQYQHNQPGSDFGADAANAATGRTAGENAAIFCRSPAGQPSNACQRDGSDGCAAQGSSHWNPDPPKCGECHAAQGHPRAAEKLAA